MATLRLDGRHWSFVLSLYRQKGVSDACLLLQERYGIDVSLLLFALYCAAEGGRICDAPRIARLDSVVAPWRNEVVTALRGLRRRLKSGPQPAPGRQTNTLRNAIKGAEVLAERIEIAALAGQFAPRRRAAAQDGADLPAIIDCVIRHFTGAAPASYDREVTAARATLARAADRMRRGSKKNAAR